MHNWFPQNSRKGFCGYCFPAASLPSRIIEISGLHRCSLCNEILQAISFGAGLGEEPIPIVRELRAFQHLAEDRISIIATFVSAPNTELGKTPLLQGLPIF